MLNGRSIFASAILLSFCMTLIFHMVDEPRLRNWVHRKGGFFLHEPSSNQTRHNSGPDCTVPQKKVVFLKTHKTAGSTVQNILLRFAREHSLNVVLPTKDNYLSKDQPFSRRRDLRDTPWESARLVYDMFCLHAVWNYEEVKQLIGPGAFYFSILRDPVDLFISYWDYYTFPLKRKFLSLEIFALSLGNKSFAQALDIQDVRRNSLLTDFGIKLADKHTVKKQIEELDSRFDMILLSEHFDESMVLLKSRLCWKTDDVTLFVLNSASRGAKSNLTEKATTYLKAWLWGDYMLYNHFREKFQLELNSFGRKNMNSELLKLRQSNKDILETCVKDTVDGSILNRNSRTYGQNTNEYRLKNPNDRKCLFYSINELSFIDHLRTSMTARAHKVLAEANKMLLKNASHDAVWSKNMSSGTYLHPNISKL